MSVTVISLDGVIATGPIASAQPHRPGLGFYHGMNAVGKVVLVSSQERSMVEHWLRVQGLHAHDYLFADPRPLAEKLAEIRALRLTVTLVVHPDPAEVVEALRLGFTTALWASPAYARPEWRPDAPPPRSWDDVVAELEQQRLNMADDPRVSSETMSYMGPR